MRYSILLRECTPSVSDFLIKVETPPKWKWKQFWKKWSKKYEKKKTDGEKEFILLLFHCESFTVSSFGVLVIDTRNDYLTLDFVWTKTFKKRFSYKLHLTLKVTQRLKIRHVTLKRNNLFSSMMLWFSKKTGKDQGELQQLCWAPDFSSTIIIRSKYYLSKLWLITKMLN